MDFRDVVQAFATICSISICGVAHDAHAQGDPGCRLRDQRGTVAVVVCPPGLGQDQLRDAGEKACFNITPCSAWMWDDPNKAPSSAPREPLGFAQKDILTTVGIWDNDKKQLWTISKVN